MKKLTALALILALLCGLCACGQSAESTQNAQETAHETALPAPSESTETSVTLSVAAAYDGDADREGCYGRAIAAYERTSGSTVTLRTGGGEEWERAVIDGLNGGEMADVLLLPVKGENAALLTAGGAVVSIETVRGEYPDYASNMKDGMLPAAADGQHYAVPTEGDWLRLYVNRSVLYNCGVDEPGNDYTWAQFITDCGTLHDNGYTPLACALGTAPEGLLDYLLFNSGAPLEAPTTDANGKTAKNEAYDGWLSVLDELTALYKRGFFPLNTLTAESGTVTDMFAYGAAAFLIGDSTVADYLAESFGDSLDNYAVVCVPAGGGRAAADAIGGFETGWYITQSAWNDPARRAAAVALVSALTADAVLGELVTTQLTALKNAAQPAELNALERSAFEAGAALTSLTPSVWDTFTDDAHSALVSDLPDLLKGNTTAERVLASTATAGEE